MEAGLPSLKQVYVVEVVELHGHLDCGLEFAHLWVIFSALSHLCTLPDYTTHFVIFHLVLIDKSFAGETAFEGQAIHHTYLSQKIVFRLSNPKVAISRTTTTSSRWKKKEEKELNQGNGEFCVYQDV